MNRVLDTAGPAETRAAAAALLRELPGRRLYALTGDLGSGKTCFVQGLAAALGVTAPVTSPTYALIQTYAAPGVRLVHADLYRIRELSEAIELGLEDEWRDPSAVVAIEWAERIEPLLPPETVRVRFDPDDGGPRRRLRIDWE